MLIHGPGEVTHFSGSVVIPKSVNIKVCILICFCDSNNFFIIEDSKPILTPKKKDFLLNCLTAYKVGWSMHSV